MGYSIRIGQAVVNVDEDGFFLAVATESRADAPVFEGDQSGDTNARSPSYSGWHRFAEANRLDAVFFSRERGLLRNHGGSGGSQDPAPYVLHREHAEVIVEARVKRQQKAVLEGLKPGWCPDKAHGDFGCERGCPYDGDLARLLWLEWWMKHAIEVYGELAGFEG